MPWFSSSPPDECFGAIDDTPCADDGVECTDDVCISEVCRHPSLRSVLLGSTLGDEETLTRSQNNHILLSFDDAVLAPEAGDLEIRRILAGCTLGDDLSGSFSMTVEEDGEGHERVVNVEDVGGVLTHREWYSISNVGGGCIPKWVANLRTGGMRVL